MQHKIDRRRFTRPKKGIGFKPGVSGNPKGSIPGRREIQTRFWTAVRAIEKRKGKSIFKRYLELAWDNENLLDSVMKKIVPDVIENENHVPSLFNFANLEDYEIDILIRKSRTRNQEPEPATEKRI